MDNSIAGIEIRETIISYKNSQRTRQKVRQYTDCMALLREVLPDNCREHFVVLHLSGCHEVVSYRIVSTGTANSSQVHPREVFQAAIIDGAVAIIVAHNHPSGEVTPSIEDIRVTKALVDSGKLLGIKVLDHIVFSDFTSISLAEQSDSSHLFN